MSNDPNHAGLHPPKPGSPLVAGEADKAAGGGPAVQVLSRSYLKGKARQGKGEKGKCCFKRNFLNPLQEKLEDRTPKWCSCRKPAKESTMF